MAFKKKTDAPAATGATSKAAYSSDDMKTAMKDIASEMAAAMIAAQKAGQPKVTPPPDPELRANCPDCGQMVGACDNKHAFIVVFPTHYPEFADAFQGRMINGHRYISDGPDHKICVPAIAEADIKRAVHDFEQNERQTRMGRVRHHDSGNARAGVVANPALDGFR
jgi:hypothetical protein